ncbi:MAG TPA: winged helix-turn-helix domain-containing protein [Terriglobales bacterium]|nr:winged helix-turn-helix domain-containing protein [Terriglobales bacterium]
MNVFPPARPPIRFGLYEADLRARELRKQGMAIKLSDISFQILEALLARPGTAISREEFIRQLSWRGTASDFEGVVNEGIQELLKALEEREDNPRFIESLPGGSYRFIGSDEVIRADLGVVDNCQVRLCWWFEGGGESAREFGDKMVASQWLRQFKTDAVRMSALRSVAAECGHSHLHSADDHSVLNFIAQQICEGRLRVYERPLEIYVGPVGTEEQAQKSSPALQPVPAAAPRAQPVEVATFGPLNAAAQVAVLVAAAAQGTPFCEE